MSNCWILAMATYIIVVVRNIWPAFLRLIYPTLKKFLLNIWLNRICSRYWEKRLQIEAADIAARSLLWEDYLKTYPESSYKRDAEYLLKQYTYFLFRGTEVSPVSEDYRDRYAVDTSHLETIIGLSSGQKSTLSTQARQFLEFLDMNPQQRQQALPADYRNRSDAEQILYYA